MTSRHTDKKNDLKKTENITIKDWKEVRRKYINSKIHKNVETIAYNVQLLLYKSYNGQLLKRKHFKFHCFYYSRIRFTMANYSNEKFQISQFLREFGY